MKATRDFGRPEKIVAPKMRKDFQSANSESHELKRSEAYFRSKRRGRFNRSDFQDLLEADLEN